MQGYVYFGTPCTLVQCDELWLGIDMEVALYFQYKEVQ